MKLAIQMLDPQSTLNNLIYINQAEIIPGETPTIMFQLVNASTKQRYIPSTGANMTIRLFSTNSNNMITKTPVQPFVSDDRSIWSFSLNSTETSKAAGVNMEITLTEGANIKKVWAQSVIVFAPLSPYKT